MKDEKQIRLNPKDYGLPARTHLEKRDDNIIDLIVRRKSRIIMTDGKKLLEKAMRIQQSHPSITVRVVTTAPICSKTRIFLEKSGIVIQEE